MKSDEENLTDALIYHVESVRRYGAGWHHPAVQQHKLAFRRLMHLRRRMHLGRKVRSLYEGTT